LDKSPSLRAITHDFNKLAQAVKDDWGPKPLVRANNRAVQKEHQGSLVFLGPGGLIA
jgi:hypothetical protein